MPRAALCPTAGGDQHWSVPHEVHLPSLPWPGQDHHYTLHPVRGEGHHHQVPAHQRAGPGWGVGRADSAGARGQLRGSHFAAGEWQSRHNVSRMVPPLPCPLLSQVQDSDMFQRDGFDVHSDVHISFTQAALGGEVKATGLNGPMMVKVCSPNLRLWPPPTSTSHHMLLSCQHDSMNHSLSLFLSRSQKVCHLTTEYGWPTGESPELITMATETIMFT